MEWPAHLPLVRGGGVSLLIGIVWPDEQKVRHKIVILNFDVFREG